MSEKIEYNYYPIIPDSIPTDAPSGGMAIDATPKPNVPAVNLDAINLSPAPNGAIMPGGQWQSPNFAVGVSGWIIRADGSVEFNNGTFRGSLAANSIDIPNATATNSWHVDSNGNMWWGPNGFAGATTRISNTGISTFSTTGQVIPAITQNFTAGEALTQGDAIMIADGSEQLRTINQITDDNVKENVQSTLWFAQSFTTSASAQKVAFVQLLLQNLGSSVNWTARLRSSLTGSDLATATQTETTTKTYRDFNFNVAVSPSTTYYIVVSVNNSDTNTNWFGSNTNTYSSGSPYKSVDSGANWSAASNVTDFCFRVFETQTVAGSVYKTRNGDSSSIDRSISSQYYDNFIGFCEVTIAAGGTVSVSMAGITTKLSGLTVGGRYYLSDTNGGISTTPGTNTVKVGKALTATTMLITIIW